MMYSTNGRRYTIQLAGNESNVARVVLDKAVMRMEGIGEQESNVWAYEELKANSGARARHGRTGRAGGQEAHDENNKRNTLLMKSTLEASRKCSIYCP